METWGDGGSGHGLWLIGQLARWMDATCLWLHDHVIVYSTTGHVETHALQARLTKEKSQGSQDAISTTAKQVLNRDDFTM